MNANDARRLERIARGFSNHWRVTILFLLAEQPKLSVREVSKSLPANYRTISEHLRRTMLAGLVRKHNVGKRVEHELTSLGKRTLAFLRTLERER